MPRMRSAAAAVLPELDSPLRETQAALTPERQHLAGAIAAVTDLEAGIVEANAAINKAEEAQYAKSRALSEAERILERSKPRPVSEYTPAHRPAGAFWGTRESYDAHLAEQAYADEPPVPLSEARDAVARAADDNDSAKRLVQFHRDRLKRMQDQLGLKRGSIKDAMRNVIRSDPALLALATEAKRLATRARAAAYAFEQATGGDIMQPGSPFYGCTEPADFRQDFDGWAVSRAWREALEGLATDAATPLPTITPVQDASV